MGRDVIGSDGNIFKISLTKFVTSHSSTSRSKRLTMLMMAMGRMRTREH
jgi:hypothetical protein